MLLAEKKSLIQFVSVFVGLSTLFLITLSLLYYENQKKIYTQILQDEMINYADTAYESIYYAKDIDSFEDSLLHDSRFKIAFLDTKRDIVYPKKDHFDIEFKKGFFTNKDRYYYIKTIELDNIKSIHYLVLSAKTIEKELNHTKKIISFALSFSIIFFGIIIFILSKLFLRPLRQYIELLNKFITDATHELNTPISILSMSLETMEKENMSQKNIRSANRMLVAIRTLSHLYNDLTFAMFYPKEYPAQTLNLEEYISQRVDYFMPLASTKNIDFVTKLKKCEIYINKTVMNRIVDNILSNAIKYNKIGGTITITLDEYSFSISDTGIGFEQSKAKDIFERYTRLDESNGGFGIGLSIVKSLCDMYQITIDVRSQLDIGTTFTLTWNNSRIIHTS